MTTAKEFSCANCGAPHGPDDIFCENCGYDFITGSLPGPAENFGAPPPLARPSQPPAQMPAPAPAASAGPGSGRIIPDTPPSAAPPSIVPPSAAPPSVVPPSTVPPSAAPDPGTRGPEVQVAAPAQGSGPAASEAAPSVFGDASSNGPGAPETGSRPILAEPTTQPTMTPGGLVVIDIAVHRSYFETVVSEGELTFPEPAPIPQRLELAGPEVHIGRTSQGRGIHPDIDVLALNADPAVSSRHAVLRLDPSGTMTITDVGSTNGTYVGSFEGNPITPGMATLLLPGAAVFLGAWTAMTVHLVP